LSEEHGSTLDRDRVYLKENFCVLPELVQTKASAASMGHDHFQSYDAIHRTQTNKLRGP
jgi:hypothetical protein